MTTYSHDYLLNKKVSILQPVDGYRASTDAVFLAAFVHSLSARDSVLDVGSGTGAVSLCLAHHFPKAQISGVEIQPQLVEPANQSARLNDFANLSYYEGDIRNKNIPFKPCSFDCVVSNPPYYSHDFPSPNKSKAFAHSHQDFDLEQWILFCLKMLKPFGRLYMVHRPEALNDILPTLSGRAGGIKIMPLYSKPGQNAKRILISAQKDSKTPTVILPPFYIHRADGTHTAEADCILRQGKLFFEH